MTIAPRALAGLLACIACVAAPAPTHAAESYDNCTGFIDSVPATISTQGTWCLRKDVSTAMASGAAVSIATNNVTLDCNGFKIGGLAAGDATQATGIASTRLNSVVRNCSVRGFLVGASLSGSGHAIMDSSFEHSTWLGVYIQGDGALVRNNRIRDTHGSTVVADGPIGLWVGEPSTSILVQGNAISAVSMDDADVTGLLAAASTGVIERNTVTGLYTLSGARYGILNNVEFTQLVMRENVVNTESMGSLEAGIGLACSGGYARDNLVADLQTPFDDCLDGGGNMPSLP